MIYRILVGSTGWIDPEPLQTFRLPSDLVSVVGEMFVRCVW